MNYKNPDVVVIGSGAGGGMSAKILAEGGLSVVLLEKGSNLFTGLGDKGRIRATHLGNDELKFVHRYLIDQDPRIEPRTYLEKDGDTPFVGRVNSLGVTVGGGTIYYDGNSPRCARKDFRIRSIYGQLPGTLMEDWPIGYEDLEPYYEDTERILGVQGEAGVNPFEEPRNPYPMPPGYSKYVSLLEAEAARRLGYHPAPTPIAINSRAYRGRPACANCGFCGSHGCAIGAKGSTAVTTIREALLTGRCELRPESCVTRIETSADGSRVEAVRYLDARGQEVRQTAGAFVLAANAIESARLCLLSANAEHPAGLGNGSGMVGRNLMFHNVWSIVGFYPFRVHGHRGRVGTHGMDDFNRAPEHGESGRPFGGGIVEFGQQLHPIAEAKNLKVPGSFHKRYMRSSLFRDRLGVVTFIGEDPPVPTNRVELDPVVRDVYGLPVARIVYAPHENDYAAADFYVPKLKKVLREAGARFVFSSLLSIQSGGIPDTKHILGTLRMGTDPATSVTDAWGKFRDLDNLYCADGGVFTTSTGYNPTLTIQALAYRQAKSIAGGR
jgi:choline dehydrogenase-like flavoprotein